MCLLTLRNGNTAGGRIVTGGSFTGHGSKVWSSRRASKGEALAVRTKMAVVCLPGCVPVQQHQSRWPAGCYILKYSNEANIVISLLRDDGVRIGAIVSISESRQSYQCTMKKQLSGAALRSYSPFLCLWGFKSGCSFCFSGVTLCLLSGVPSSLVLFGPGLMLMVDLLYRCVVKSCFVISPVPYSCQTVGERTA